MPSLKRALTLAVIACAGLPAVATTAAVAAERGPSAKASAKAKAAKKKAKRARARARAALAQAPVNATATCVGTQCTVIYRQDDDLCVMTVEVGSVPAAVVSGPICGRFVLGDPRPDQQ
jgi:hypothetical protein